VALRHGEDEMSNYLVITGGSHGIGEKTISLFKQHHWQVINISRTNSSIPDVTNINIDLSDTSWPDTYAHQLNLALQGAEKLCLVHNAATFKSDSIATLAANDLLSVLNVNLISAVALNKILIPAMKVGSSIVYIGSTLSEQAVPNRASYVISKHAVVGLMRSTCQDLAEKGIHTCCVCPGFVNTQMLTRSVPSDILAEIIRAKVIAKRLIEPEEVADFIYFCAQHSIVNGSLLHANLGQITT
jgi:3-oxoacyl-[acyl-carrier protein] reductase